MNSIDKKTIGWNMYSSLLMAFQSVILLMIITRVLGIEEAGVYTLAYATANLLLTIGKYGVRVFQVSDRKNKYIFQDYLIHRVITTILMLSVMLVYIFWINKTELYDRNKVMIIIWMCIYKAIDSIEDVYIGEYHRNSRLDYGAKCLTYRLLVTIITYGVLVVTLKNQLKALIYATSVSMIALIVMLAKSGHCIRGMKVDKEKILGLTKDSTPLFITTFFVLFLANAPKYSIDRILGDVEQAYFGYIAMPLFIVGLLNGFIFNPLIDRISECWNQGKYIEFDKYIKKQLLIVGGITGVCLMGGVLLGVPVLSMLYSVNLEKYKSELSILLIGSGILGGVGVYTTVLTIIREQKMIMTSHVVVSILVFFTMDHIVETKEIMGASRYYLLYMFIVYICLRIAYRGIIKKKIKEVLDYEKGTR